MFKKLLKYDLKAIYKYLVIFYAIFLSCAILARLSMEFGHSNFTFILGEIFKGAVTGFIIGAVINNAMHVWEYFRANFYGDRSYLTHTLPISTRTLFLAKILTAIISSFTTVTLSLIAIFIVYGNAELFTFFEELYSTLGPDIIFKCIIPFFIVLYLEFIFIVQCGLTGIILGHKFNSNKILYSVIIGFATFIISGYLTVMGILIWSIFDSRIAWIFSNNAPDLSIVDSLLAASILFYSIYNIALYYIETKALKLGVDVD